MFPGQLEWPEDSGTLWTGRLRCISGSCCCRDIWSIVHIVGSHHIDRWWAWDPSTSTPATNPWLLWHHSNLSCSSLFPQWLWTAHTWQQLRCICDEPIYRWCCWWLCPRRKRYHRMIQLTQTSSLCFQHPTNLNSSQQHWRLVGCFVYWI